MGPKRPFTIVDLNYISLYFADLDKTVAFYTAVFGEPDSADPNHPLYGWQMGNTWLTLFSSKIGTNPAANPANTEFAIQVASAEEVDMLHQRLVDAGAKNFWAPEDTQMYEKMRFSCVDDPFGVRINVIYPLNK